MEAARAQKVSTRYREIAATEDLLSRLTETEQDVEKFQRASCESDLEKTCLIERLRTPEEKRYLFEQLQTLARGNNASALEAKLGASDCNLIVKVQNGSEDEDDYPYPIGSHEAAIGLFVADRLREEGCLNFSKMYGMFRCNNLYDDVFAWCYTSGPAAYLIYEKIKGVDFDKFILTASEDEIVNCFLQIALALQHAQKYSFTHYDLHGANVIIRPAPKGYLRYVIDGKEFFLYNHGYIATMIDYGLSHAIVDGRHYYEIVPKALIGPESNPTTDLHKLLISLVSIPQGKAALQPVLDYFTDDAERYMWGVYNYYANIAPGHDYGSFLQYLLTTYDIESAAPSAEEVLLTLPECELKHVANLTDYYLLEQVGREPEDDVRELIELEAAKARTIADFLDAINFADLEDDDTEQYYTEKYGHAADEYYDEESDNGNTAKEERIDEVLDVYYALYLSVKLLKHYGYRFDADFKNFSLDKLRQAIETHPSKYQMLPRLEDYERYKSLS